MSGRGRPKMDSKDLRQCRITVRLTEEEKRSLDEECERLGISHSRYFRRLHKTYLSVDDPNGLSAQAYRQGVAVGVKNIGHSVKSIIEALEAAVNADVTVLEDSGPADSDICSDH